MNLNCDILSGLVSLCYFILAADRRLPRVLCWVLTHKKHHDTKASAVHATWGQRCDKLLFFSNADNSSLNAIRIIEGEDSRAKLTLKTFRAFHYIAKRFLHEYDWFLKADDDTYIVVENLRHMLQSYDPDKPAYLGQLFRPPWGDGLSYHSGGAGYVVSREALHR